MERNLSSSIVQQSTWVLLLDLSAKSDAQFSKPAPFGEELKGSKKREKKSSPRDYANRKSLRTGDPENSGFNSIQLQKDCVSFM